MHLGKLNIYILNIKSFVNFTKLFILKLFIIFNLLSCSLNSEKEEVNSEGATQEDSILEEYNKAAFNFNEILDMYLLKPSAEFYRENTPTFIQTGIKNFFSNIEDFFIMINNFLQFKIREGLSDIGRILINTYLGFYGLFDFATPAGFKKHNETFGQTLATWGINSDTYIVLPFFGPSTLTDATGLYIQYNVERDENITPDLIVKVKQNGYLTLLDIVRYRSELLDLEELIIGDRYEFIKNSYLQRRKHLINDGKNDEQQKQEELELYQNLDEDFF